jgi:Tol biopolymer transport system component
MTTSTNSRGLKTSRYPGRNTIQPGQVSQLIIANLADGTETLVLQSDKLVESPNWTPDGKWLVRKVTFTASA